MKSKLIDITIKIGKIYRVLLKSIQNIMVDIPNNNINTNELLLWYEIKFHEHTTPKEIAEQGLYVISYVLFNLKNLERKKLLLIKGLDPEKLNLSLNDSNLIKNILDKTDEKELDYLKLLDYTKKILNLLGNA